MRHAIALLACLAPALAAVPATALAATLTVTVDGVEPGGTVFVAVCRGGLDQGSCGDGQVLPASGTRLRVDIPDLAPGPVAVAVFEDFNGNRTLDRTPLGLPLEPFGFSNGAGRDGRPNFNAAAFGLVEPGASVRVRLVRILRR